MSLVALVEPQTLLGQSLQEILRTESGVELSLLGFQQDEFATLTQVEGDAAVIHPVTAAALAEADVAVLLGSGRTQREALELLPERTPGIIVASDLDHPEGEARVAGLAGSDPGARILLSPHPVVVLLGHLLAALAEHDPTRLTGTVMLPASTRDGRALDELFEQTRAILSFSDQQPREVFGAQLAFNLLPAPSEADLAGQVRRALGRYVEVAVDLVTGPVFHGVAASLLVEMADAASGDAVDESLESSPLVALRTDAAGPGPIDVAGRDEILVAPTRQDLDRPDARWIWAVMDNLTLGGATNAARLVRDVLASTPDA